MDIYITRTRGFESSILRKVWDLLVLHDGPMKFHLAERPIFFETNKFEWGFFFKAMQNYRSEIGLKEDQYLVALTELSNAPNWFSAVDPEGTNNIFIHGKEWENYIYCDPCYPIAFEVILNCFDRLFFKEKEDFNFAHDPAIGCINDMCSWKPDITYKFRTADICHDCLKRSKELGISEDFIKQILRICSSFRQKMLFSAELLEEDNFDNHLPFNVAITKRKISSTNEPLRKFLFLIDHFDSLIRTSVLFWSSINHTEEDRQLFFEKEGLQSRPSLGTWLQTLQHLIGQYKTTVQLNDSINKKLKQLASLAEQNSIVSIRNEKRGHGYIECNDEGYKNIFLQNSPVVTEIESLLTPLFVTNKMYHINRSSIVGNGLVEVSSLELSGSYAVYSERQNIIQTKDFAGVPIEKYVYIYNTQQEKWYNLNPYFLFDHCPICMHQRLLVYDGGDLYLDPLEGHRTIISSFKK